MPCARPVQSTCVRQPPREPPPPTPQRRALGLRDGADPSGRHARRPLALRGPQSPGIPRARAVRSPGRSQPHPGHAATRAMPPPGKNSCHPTPPRRDGAFRSRQWLRCARSRQAALECRLGPPRPPTGDGCRAGRGCHRAGTRPARWRSRPGEEDLSRFRRLIDCFTIVTTLILNFEPNGTYSNLLLVEHPGTRAPRYHSNSRRLIYPQKFPKNSSG